MTGHGFRTRGGELSSQGGSHNAYVNLMSETGIPVGITLLIALGLISADGYRTVKRYKTKGEWGRVIAVSNAALFALLIGLFFQPQIFNIGDSIGLLLMFLLGTPYYLYRFPALRIKLGRAAAA